MGHPSFDTASASTGAIAGQGRTLVRGRGLIQINSDLVTSHVHMMSVILCKETFSEATEHACRTDYGRFALACGNVGRAAKREMRLPFMGESRRIHRPVAQSMSYPSCKVFVGTHERRRGMATSKHGVVVQMESWRLSRSRHTSALDEFGPPLAPVVGTEHLTQHLELGFALDGDCQLCGARAIGVGNVLEMPQRRSAALGESLTLGLAGKVFDEGQQGGHASITPDGVRARQHQLVSPRVSTHNMSDEAAIRRENFKRLVAQRRWGVRGLAGELGYGRYSYWNDLLNDTSKPFGEKAARKIEEKAGLPRGWLDSHDEVPAARPVDKAAELSPLEMDHQMVFGLLSEADQQEIHALACAIVMEKNPKLVAVMTQAGVSKRADDSKVAAWKAQIDSGEFAIPNQKKPQREGLMNKPAGKRKHA